MERRDDGLPEAWARDHPEEAEPRPGAERPDPAAGSFDLVVDPAVAVGPVAAVPVAGSAAAARLLLILLLLRRILLVLLSRSRHRAQTKSKRQCADGQLGC